MIGLGRMGGNMSERLRLAGHEVVGYDRDPKITQAADLDDLVRQLGDAPRVAWVMVPSGQPTDDVIIELVGLLSTGDIVVDGGNSNWRDSQRHAEELGAAGIGFVDAGVSGGIWGLQEGYCLMVGGAPEHVAVLQPAFDALAPPDGFAHVGPAGAGHFTKMVHNGIEYGLMQAYAEGFEIIEHSEFDVDLHELSGIWRYGSVVRSWLLELLHSAFEEHGNELDDIAPWVEDSGEGRWTIAEAIAENVPAPVISAALFARFASRDEINFAAKVSAALRNQFGGHAIKALAKAEAHSEDPRSH
jgi:6-phosphogluconate dehydrogenase